MKKKLLPLLFVSLFALTNCTGSNLSPSRIQPVNQLSVVQQQAVRVEDAVSIERLRENVSIFSGARTFNGTQRIEERGTKTGRTLTRQFLRAAMAELGYKTEDHIYKSGFSYNGANVFAKLMATEPTDEYILVGAHMDSVTNPGADDNASGSAAVLEAAAILKNMPVRKLNIIFAWFDQEELGLIGSKEMADDFKKNNMKLNSVHIVDMMGWDADGDSMVEVARPQGFLWDYYKMVNEKHNLNLPLFRTSLSRSDHYSFETKGYNSVLLIEEYVNQDFNQHYHKKTDTAEKINYEFLTLGTKLLVAAVSDLAMKVPAPKNIKFIPHDNFPTRSGFCGDVEDDGHFHH